MADAGTVLSRGNSCPLSCHRPSQRLPWLSCRKALHPRRAADGVFGDWEHTLPKALEQLFGGKAALRGRDTHEPVSWKHTSEQERESTLPKDFCWAQLQVCSALREEPRVSVLASTCLGCSENPMHQTAKYLW